MVLIMKTLVFLFALTSTVFAGNGIERQFNSDQECLKFKTLLEEVAKDGGVKAYGFCDAEYGSFQIVGSQSDEGGEYGENPSSEQLRHVCTRSVQRTIVPTFIPFPLISSKKVMDNLPASGKGKTEEEARIKLAIDVEEKEAECHSHNDIRSRCGLTEVKCYTE